MKRRRIRTAVAVPLVVASAGWAAHVATTTDPPDSVVSADPVVTADPAAGGAPVIGPTLPLPDGSVVSATELPGPASISAPRKVRSASEGRPVPIVSRPTASSIPAVALAAYQRAESLIGSADRSCHLPWQLIAAVGRVESDHGRFGGATLAANGVSRPAIIGPALDGTHSTALIRDTDAGRLDGDKAFDHAVGPLQFIPSTWAVVGVDGDADGQRDPQDIDDAALAAAVYLCSGADDLGTTTGLRDAVFRYNHSTAYVDEVLAITDDYLAGVEVVTTGSSVQAGYLVPMVPLTEQPGAVDAALDPVEPGGTELDAALGTGHGHGKGHGNGHGHQHGHQHGHGGGHSDGHHSGEPATDAPVTDPVAPADPVAPSPASSPTPSPEPTPTPDPSPEPMPTPDPTDPTTELPSVPGEDPTDLPTGDPTDAPTEDPTDPPTGEPRADVVLLCTLAGYVDDPEVDDDPYDLCLLAYDDPAPAPTPTAPVDRPGVAALPVD